MIRLIILASLLFIPTVLNAQSVNNGYNENIDDQIIQPNIDIPNEDYFELFFNTFKNARMYFNFRDQTPSTLCQDIYQRACEKPYNQQLLEGDYFVTNLIKDGFQHFYKININNKNYFIEAGTFINYFDNRFFYEMPRYYSDNYIEQLNIYFSRLEGKILFVSTDTPLSLYLCSDQTLATYPCENGKKINQERLSIINYNRKSMDFLVNINNNQIKVPAALIISLMQNFILIRERF